MLLEEDAQQHPATDDNCKTLFLAVTASDAANGQPLPHRRTPAPQVTATFLLKNIFPLSGLFCLSPLLLALILLRLIAPRGKKNASKNKIR